MGAALRTPEKHNSRLSLSRSQSGSLQLHAIVEAMDAALKIDRRTSTSSTNSEASGRFDTPTASRTIRHDTQKYIVYISPYNDGGAAFTVTSRPSTAESAPTSARRPCMHASGTLAKMTALSVTSIFVASRDALALPSYYKHLTRIHFHDQYDEPLDSLAFVLTLRELRTGEVFNHSLAPLKGLNLTLLHLGRCFNQELYPLGNQTLLAELVLGRHFTYGIGPIAKLEKLTTLTFMPDMYGEAVDWPMAVETATVTSTQLEGLTYLRFRPRLTTLTICGHSILDYDFLYAHKNVVSITWVDGFDGYLGEVSAAPELRFLSLGPTFNMDIGSLENLRNLVTLVLGDAFNYPIDVVAKLKTLASLTLGSSFMQPIGPVAQCPSLRTLTMAPGYPLPFDELVVPGTLLVLRCGEHTIPMNAQTTRTYRRL